MYLAGKLSKFEVLDWAGRQPKHLRWWDMFVEDVTMDLLEGKISQYFLHTSFFVLLYCYSTYPNTCVHF